MCGCGGNGGFSGMSSGGACGGLVKTLRTVKNKTQTLYTLETDPNKKAEYLAIKQQIEGMIALSITTCPSSPDVEALKIYVNNEYTKYYI